MTKKELTPIEQNNCIQILKERFEKNMHRHQDLDWQKIEESIINQPEKIWSLHQMEITGGEPDVIFYDDKTDEYHIVDCSAESPKERRSLAYDYEGQTSRKEHQPKNNAIDVAKNMKIELLTEEEYRLLQAVEIVDQKTSSWLKTPEKIKELGGAIFGDYRYRTVFIYHNGAQSYYAARGFRGILKV